MNEDENGKVKTLAELQAEDLPRGTPENFHLELEIKPENRAEMSEEELEMAEAELERSQNIIAEYLKKFTPLDERENPNIVTGGIDCLMCGKGLDGFTGTFRWGMRHGEGKCSNCGYPYRAIHYIRDDEEEPLLVLRHRVFAYHPDELSTEAEEKEQEV